MGSVSDLQYYYRYVTIHQNLQNPSKEVCQCCESRYSRIKYSKKGQSCKQCEKYYTAAALGEFEEHHDPGNDRRLVSKTENAS